VTATAEGSQKRGPANKYFQFRNLRRWVFRTLTPGRSLPLYFDAAWSDLYSTLPIFLRSLVTQGKHFW